MKNTILLSALLLASLTATAAPELKEVYAQLDGNTQIVLTNQSCLKWETPEGMQLNYAYGLDTASGYKITGCFTHEANDIIIELSDDGGENKMYHFKLKADRFILRPTI